VESSHRGWTKKRGQITTSAASILHDYGGPRDYRDGDVAAFRVRVVSEKEEVSFDRAHDEWQVRAMWMTYLTACLREAGLVSFLRRLP